MANDAHLRLAADFLGLLAEMSSPGYFAGAANSPARCYLKQSGEELYLVVVDGDENQTSFTMHYSFDDANPGWQVGGGY